MQISFRVHAVRVGFPDRTVTISANGAEASCDCDGFTEVFRRSNKQFCSHIDATLLANERSMVPEADRLMADQAAKLVFGKISAPEDWKGSWRRNMAWRGLSRRGAVVNPRDSGKPLVCFTGTLPGKSRKEWIAEAVASGWETTDNPSRFTDVLVAADPVGKSAKLKAARQHNTAVVTASDWEILIGDGVLPVI